MGPPGALPRGPWGAIGRISFGEDQFFAILVFDEFQKKSGLKGVPVSWHLAKLLGDTFSRSLAFFLHPWWLFQASKRIQSSADINQPEMGRLY